MGGGAGPGTGANAVTLGPTIPKTTVATVHGRQVISKTQEKKEDKEVDIATLMDTMVLDPWDLKDKGIPIMMLVPETWARLLAPENDEYNWTLVLAATAMQQKALNLNLHFAPLAMDRNGQEQGDEAANAYFDQATNIARARGTTPFALPKLKQEKTTDLSPDQLNITALLGGFQQLLANQNESMNQRMMELTGARQAMLGSPPSGQGEGTPDSRRRKTGGGLFADHTPQKLDFGGPGGAPSPSPYPGGGFGPSPGLGSGASPADVAAQQQYQQYQQQQQQYQAMLQQEHDIQIRMQAAAAAKGMGKGSPDSTAMEGDEIMEEAEEAEEEAGGRDPVGGVAQEAAAPIIIAPDFNGYYHLKHLVTALLDPSVPKVPTAQRIKLNKHIPLEGIPEEFKGPFLNADQTGVTISGDSADDMFTQAPQHLIQLAAQMAEHVTVLYRAMEGHQPGNRFQMLLQTHNVRYSGLKRRNPLVIGLLIAIARQQHQHQQEQLQQQQVFPGPVAPLAP
jgi:hypothetical protein